MFMSSGGHYCQDHLNPSHSQALVVECGRCHAYRPGQVDVMSDPRAFDVECDHACVLVSWLFGCPGHPISR